MTEVILQGSKYIGAGAATAALMVVFLILFG